MFEAPQGFTWYPIVPTIKALTHDRKGPRYITGRVVTGERISSQYMYELILQHSTGHMIQLFLYDNHHNIPYMPTRRAILQNAVIYVSFNKLVRQPTMNILRSTELTSVVIEPNIPEARNIGFKMRSCDPCQCIVNK
ncbi:hypothetical protein QVD17_05934 [Tagetes erecta]|uniref:Uncharacterized protein n=1 Tax=Tagetes erecta TaxID=13708 RepID=A0AAD8LFZ3_TARER|nr:hypothetical protein QVD17_05934 [Tagetes erecta]